MSHILFLNWRDTRNPEGGGSEVYTERVAAELVARGHRVTLLCAAHRGAPAEQVLPTGVHVLRRGGRHTVYLRAALTYLAGGLGLGRLGSGRLGLGWLGSGWLGSGWLGLGRLAAGALGRPDLIVDVCNGVPFLSPLYARCPTVVVVHHVHREQWPVVLGGWRGRCGWWLESVAAPRVYRRCRYVTVSAATRDELVGLGVSGPRISIIHNGLSGVYERVAPVSPYPSMLVLGRLVPHKRVEYALDLLAALAPDLPGLRLVVAGQGWWEAPLRSYAEGLGVADRTDFAGYVPESRKLELLSSAWVVLVPSLKEGWGLTIMEAAACGTPAVAFRSAGGVRDAILDGRTGVLADSPADLRATVRRLLTDEPARRRMGAAARRYASTFTWAAAGEQLAALVDEVLAPRNRQRAP